MKTIYLSSSLLICLAWAHIAHAHNTFFLPGDAFFHTVLTEEVLDQIEKDENPIFTYSRPDFIESSFCGYAGFSKLEFRSMPLKVKQRLRDVYDQLRDAVPKQVEITDEVVYQKGELGDIAVKTGKKIRREINGFSVFIINGDFDFSKYVLGLKYNEAWADQVTAFSHDRNHVRLESFIQTPEAIAEDWRDSRLVAPLSTECPISSKNNISFPAIVAPTCKFMILASPDLRKLTHSDDHNYMHEISAGGVTRYTKKGKHWVRQKTRRSD